MTITAKTASEYAQRRSATFRCSAISRPPWEWSGRRDKSSMLLIEFRPSRIWGDLRYWSVAADAQNDADGRMPVVSPRPIRLPAVVNTSNRTHRDDSRRRAIGPGACNPQCQAADDRSRSNVAAVWRARWWALARSPSWSCVSTVG